MQRAGAQCHDFLGHLFRLLCELPSHGGRQVDHFQTLRLQTDLLEDPAREFSPAFGVFITFQVMAISGQSTRHQYAVGAVLESM